MNLNLNEFEFEKSIGATRWFTGWTRWCSGMF